MAFLETKCAISNFICKSFLKKSDVIKTGGPYLVISNHTSVQVT